MELRIYPQGSKTTTLAESICRTVGVASVERILNLNLLRQRRAVSAHFVRNYVLRGLRESLCTPPILLGAAALIKKYGQF